MPLFLFSYFKFYWYNVPILCEIPKYYNITYNIFIKKISTNASWFITVQRKQKVQKEFLQLKQMYYMFQFTWDFSIALKEQFDF